ncbi:urease accessory protein [Eubacterium aggregans]|uniref:Urease accessory protein UreF n=1 Tax=Eubacterium aggregans TaxID=81409 RepID=A0A1H3WUZ3_9FIRM|nr:urease accessory protein UreF [Eubacterium aggregans]SDZ90790.1 urease accessory protein [Eubacterium aggregans]
MATPTDFLLLQINDALFPIGGYSHSWGLETYIQEGIVADVQGAGDYIRSRLRHSLLYTELLAVRLAYEAAARGDGEALSALDDILEASVLPRESREAMGKLGSRFIKTLDSASLPALAPVWGGYRSAPGVHHHAVAYGVLCAAAGIGKAPGLSHFLYAQASAMVTTCVKTIPLSQTLGQALLAELHPLLTELVVAVEELPESMLCVGCPGFDIRGMAHEVLYSRLYMS